MKFVRPRSGSADSLGGVLLAARGLPPDLLAQASERLERLSFGVAIFLVSAFVLDSLLAQLGVYVFPHLELLGPILIAMALVSAAVVLLCRSGRLTPTQLLDVGLAYEVLIAIGISLGDHLAPLSPDQPLSAVSWLFVWIILFPLIVPDTPAKTFVAGFVAASTWPLAFFAGQRYLGHPSPPVQIVALNFLENYIAAAIALIPNRIVRKLGAQMEKARTLGSYELIERLDQGGMGEVWRARHRMLARPAAIKLIRPEVLGLKHSRLADTLVRRFEREAQATAALQSPHTIVLYDFGLTAEGTFYHVMELLDGLDLQGLVRRFGPLPPERVVHLLLQACHSLAEAHAVGLIHRDVKPANLFTCRKGREHDFVKVLDFGLVRSAWGEPADGEAPLTEADAVPGTLAYMAPEAILGASAIDARIDLYALGCVGYWLLTGQTVFEGTTPASMAMHHVQTPPVPPSTRMGQAVPEALERVMLRCLEKDRARRPATAEELGDELRACVTPGVWDEERARRWWTTHLSRAVPSLGGDLENPTLSAL